MIVSFDTIKDMENPLVDIRKHLFLLFNNTRSNTQRRATATTNFHR